jgi:DNA polymerase-3 subunit alpha
VENFYYRPILSYETIEEFPHDGIYCTSACALGTIAKNILDNNIQGAIDYAEKFNDLFDGNFALELQFHPDFKEQAIINEKLVEISDKLDIPLTVSCDSHFLDEDDRDLRRIVQAISWHKQYEDVKDSLQSNCLGNTELIKKFAIESGFLYLDVVEDAIMQTNKIASICNAELEISERRIPVFDKHDELDELFEVIG